MWQRLWQRLAGLLVLTGMVTPAFALDSTHLTQGIETLATIVQDIGVCAGVGMFLSSLFKFKRYGEMRTFMSQQQTILKPLAMMFSGVCLMCLPMITQTLLLAVWGYSNPLAYPQMISADATAIMRPVFQLARLVGIIGIFRGLMLLSRAGSEGSQPGTVGKSLLHILGGVMCINIYSLYSVISDLFK